jgi:transcriptional regulator with XRE-family HTH domain
MENLKSLRESRKITQSQLGEYLGAKKSAISLWESGKRQPDQETLVRIATYFDVTVDYLLGREEQSSTPEEKSPAYDPLTERIMAKAKKMNTKERQDLLKIIDIVMGGKES